MASSERFRARRPWSELGTPLAGDVHASFLIPFFTRSSPTSFSSSQSCIATGSRAIGTIGSSHVTSRALFVIKPGFLTTVQDLGRAGWRRYGVPLSGALDWEALRFANKALGNDANAAGLEMWGVGPTLRSLGLNTVVVAGGLFGPNPGFVQPLADGEELVLTPSAGSARAILAVQGGLDVPSILSSRSTALAGGFGGLAGRRLEKGDVLRIGGATRSAAAPSSWRLPEELLGSSNSEVSIRVLSGPQESLFSQTARDLFYGSTYQIASESNRVGLRLTGPEIQRSTHEELPSEPATVGTIQITHAGQPIVLLNDGPTAGGYPKLATVWNADLPHLVRARQGQRIRFIKGGLDEARAALHLAEKRLADWRVV